MSMVSIFPFVSLSSVQRATPGWNDMGGDVENAFCLNQDTTY
jgi:hypothetical protein